MRAALRTMGARVGARLEDTAESSSVAARLTDLSRELDELESRIARLIGEVEDRVGPLTGDQTSEHAYYRRTMGTLRSELAQALR
jgi:hypothetical protein